MNKPLFFNDDGTLTEYGLSCGYREQHSVKGIELTLWKEHSTYHVRMHDFNKHKRILWEVFPDGELTRARKLFNDIKEEMNAQAKG
jgi:hypothetical protein